MDISYIINPFVTSGVFAVVLSMSLIWLLWANRGNLDKFFTRTTFFWLVNIVFMAISAYHAAPFFGSVVSTLPGLEWAEKYIGLPVALVIDGITIVFMQARMEASYKRDDRKRDMYTRYVACAAGLNTVANLYTSIEHFQSGSYTHLWPLMQGLAPVVLSVFPMFLVAISKAADEMVNIKPLDKLNVEEFKAQEQKRVDILDAQAHFLDKEAIIMQRLIRVEAMQKRNEILRRGIAQKASWWPWGKTSEVSVYEIVASAQDACIADLEQQLVQARVQGCVQEGMLPPVNDEAQSPVQESEYDLVQGEVQIVDVYPVTNLIDLSARRSARENELVNEESSAIGSESEPFTGQWSQLNAKIAQKVQAGEKVKKANRLLKKNPNMTAKALAIKVGISESYASKLKAQFGKEGA